jgi:hypothetical protein
MSRPEGGSDQVALASMRAASGILRAEVDFAYLMEYPYCFLLDSRVHCKGGIRKSHGAEGDISNDVVKVDFRVEIGRR